MSRIVPKSRALCDPQKNTVQIPNSTNHPWSTFSIKNILLITKSNSNELALEKNKRKALVKSDEKIATINDLV